MRRTDIHDDTVFLIRSELGNELIDTFEEFVHHPLLYKAIGCEQVKVFAFCLRPNFSPQWFYPGVELL